MATILVSNKAYRGIAPLPNLMDITTGEQDKLTYLTFLASEDAATKDKINSGNAESLFDRLKAHNDRVVADGGVVFSLLRVLKALIFQTTNAVAGADFAAYGAALGVKAHGTRVAKLYDISPNRRDLVPTSGDFIISTDRGIDVLEGAPKGALVAQIPMPASNGGFLLGGSAHDVSSAGGVANRVRPMILSLFADGSSLPHATLEVNQGESAKLAYIQQSGVTSTMTFPQTAGVYNEYSGIVGVLADEVSPKIIENGVAKNSVGYLVKSQVGVSVYPNITIDVLGGKVRESWVVRSASTAVATALSVHLDEGV